MRMDGGNGMKHGAAMNGRHVRALAALVVALVAGALGLGGEIGPLLQQLGLPAATEAGGGAQSAGNAGDANDTASAATSATLAAVPAYSGEPYVYIAADANHPHGTPTFTDSEVARAQNGTFEDYSPLDALGRCGTATACVGRETMPTSRRRGDISQIHPTGWRQNFYDFVDQEALYNRCHLIARSLAAEEANAQNLITGTRYLNTQGMLPFEEATVAYIRRTGNHVLYRVTPLFDGDNLLASGVHMEARSVEDDGAGVCFNIYCYNVEPGVRIDYATGANEAA